MQKSKSKSNSRSLVRYFCLALALFCIPPSYASTLQCDTTVVVGSNYPCELDKAAFCQTIIEVDTNLKKITIISKKSSSKAVEPIIEHWDDRFIKFSHWTHRMEATPESPGYVVIKVSELNRLTGAYEEREEYRHETGLKFSQEELNKLLADKSMGFLSAKPPTAESIIKCNTQPVRYRDGQALRTTHG